MGFQVKPQSLGPRRAAWPGFLVAIASLAIVAASLATAAGSTPEGQPAAVDSASNQPVAAAIAVPRPTGVVRASQQPAATSRPSASPASIECHVSSLARCNQIANAAVGQMPNDSAPIETVSVWDSILCNSNDDCPSSRFQGYRPLGSAIVSFGPGRRQAWVNVVEPEPFPGWVWVPADNRAWIIRWVG
jgi:hypothetical protein